MKIFFLHGWQSTLGGIKPTCLKDHGHEVLNMTGRAPKRRKRPEKSNVG